MTENNYNKDKFLKKFLFIFIGVVSLGLGVIGIFLPILPTTPFILISVYCFARSSEKMHLWLINTKLYKKILEKFINKKGITIKSKLIIIVPVSILLLFLFLIFNNLWIRIIIIILFVMKILFFIKIPTIKNKNT